MKKFNEFKAEILRRAKDADACDSDCKRIIESKTFAQLMEFIKSNFLLCCMDNIIEETIFSEYKSEFNSNDIYLNESRDSGYLLVTGNVDRICGDCNYHIKKFAKVNKISGFAHGVIAGNAVVNELCKNSTAIVTGNAEVKLITGEALFLR